MLAAAAVFIAVSGNDRVRTSASVPLPGGTLVYAAKGAAGAVGLFRWDLETGRVSAGPTIPGLDTLARADPHGEGWIGVITRSPSDLLTASTLRSLSPGARLTPLLEGRLVAFDSGGSSVVAVTEGATTRGCSHRLVISEREIATRVLDRQYEATTCARVLTLARARGTTYVTRQRGDRISVDFVGYKVLHEILPRYAVMSVSAASDMLVVSSRDMVGFPAATPPVLGAAGPAALYFQGIGALDPIPFAEGIDPLSLGDVLAWSPDSAAALVTGRMGADEGIFELAMGPGASPRRPVFIAPSRRPVWATYADGGTAFLSTEGQIYALRDERLDALSLPPGAPTPVGPLIWVH